MDLDKKVILTKSELNSLLEEAIRAGISMGESEVYKTTDSYRKVSIVFASLMDAIPASLKLFFE